MGINVAQKSNKTYVRLMDGKLIIETNPEDPHAERMEVKNPSTGQVVMKYVIPVRSITGVISHVKCVTRELKDTKVKPFKEIQVTIKDGEEEILLTVKFKTDQGINLVNRLAAYVKLNLAKTPVTIGAYKMQNMDTKRFNQGFYIHYGDGIKLANLYTKENMPPSTQWKQVERNGELEWDKTEYLRHYMNVLEKEIIPYFENLKKGQEPIQDSFSDADEDIF
jgi:hypothetical protein